MASTDLGTTQSWFVVLNHPEDYGYTGTPEEICKQLRDAWIKDSDTRSGAWAYCISAAGLHHVHMVCEDKKNMRFSKVKEVYPKAHIEPTKGRKAEAEDYINKKGKYAEKGEEVVCCITHGDIVGAQGKRTDFDKYACMIEDGCTVSEIIDAYPKAIRYKNHLKDLFFYKKQRDTPEVREMKVYWHTGESGTGKSYTRISLIEQYGADNIFYLTTFGAGAFDNYAGQKILWIEDYRGEFHFSMFLRILDVYKAELPARYANTVALWEEVHITSVLTPQGCYPANTNSRDSINQLLRRITSVIYHFKINGGFYSLEFDPYTTYNTMWNQAQKYVKGCPMPYQLPSAITLDDVDEFEEVQP